MRGRGLTNQAKRAMALRKRRMMQEQNGPMMQPRGVGREFIYPQPDGAPMPNTGPTMRRRKPRY